MWSDSGAVGTVPMWSSAVLPVPSPVLPVPSPAGMVTIATTGCRNKKGTRFRDVRAVSKIEQKVVTMSAGEGTGSTELRR